MCVTYGKHLQDATYCSVSLVINDALLPPETHAFEVGKLLTELDLFIIYQVDIT